MLKQLLILLPSALCLLPSVALADWTPVARSPQGDVISVDQSNIGVDGNTRAFWVDVTHASGNVAVSRVLMAANCGTNHFTRLWLIQGNRQGQVVVNNRVTEPITQAGYNTINSDLINTVCTGGVSDPQLAALTRARQTNAEVINRAMESAAQMFR